MIKTKVDLLEGRLLSSQSKQALGSWKKGLIGWNKAGPPKNPLLFLLCKQAILLC